MHDTNSEKTASPNPIRVFIVDDHALVRVGLRLVVERQADMCVVGEAGSGASAREGIGEQRPDVVLMDVSMPDGDGLETTIYVKQHWSHVKVLMLTMHEDHSYLMKLLDAGASGYALKRSGGEEFIRAIRFVATGAAYVDPNLTTTLVKNLSRKAGRSAQSGELVGQALSERETEVLGYVAEGYTNKEIGAKLKISEKTVETYKTRSMKKLDLGSRVEVIRYALQQGWLESRAIH